MELAQIADRIAKRGDLRTLPGWQEILWDEIGFANYGALDSKQSDIVFDMVVARWDKAVKRAAS